jgi:hypothetical protein
MKRLPVAAVNSTLLLLLAACGTTGSSPSSAQQTQPSESGPAPSCAAAKIRCEDQSIQQLKLRTVINDGEVAEEGSLPGEFLTRIDARAGGLAATMSYAYVSFDEAGLQKQPITDEEALGSMDWDLAVRRYVVRLNSGVSGPSCVEAARLPPGTSFDSLTEVPDGLSWRTEVYFTESCDYVPDSSGIGAPGTALASFWSYTSCVQMSGNLFVVRLRDGRYVKLQIVGYYDLPAQQECDRTGTVPVPNGAGNLRLRWSFLRGPTAR